MLVLILVEISGALSVVAESFMERAFNWSLVGTIQFVIRICLYFVSGCLVPTITT